MSELINYIYYLRTFGMYETLMLSNKKYWIDWHPHYDIIREDIKMKMDKMK